MARLNSWLSPDVIHALGWALIHSLWQCLAMAAVAAVLMAFSRRPSVRYLAGVGALAAMLAAPVATFFVLRPAHLVPAAGPPVVAQPIAGQAAVPHSVAPDVKSDSLKGAPPAPTLMQEDNRLFLPKMLPWLVTAWLCGVTFFSLRFAGGFLLLQNRRRHTTIPNAGILALCQDVQRQLGLDRAIQYLECGWLQAPAVIGWLSPIVLIPVSALTGLSEAQLRAVIAHELAHIRRFDLLVNLFQIMVEALLFYHPAVWWLNKRIRIERELCCDEIAVAASGRRLEYAQALTLMAEWEAAPRLAMAANRDPLSERIFHILGRKSAGAGQRMLGLTGSVLFLIAALAAANALFTIAAPPIAQAKESVKAVLSASQITVAHLTQQVLRADEPAAKTSTPQLARRADPTVADAAPDRREVSKGGQDQNLAPPSVDLSGLPPVNALTTPTVLASNAPAATIQKDQAAAPPMEPVVMANTPSGANGDPNAIVCRAPQRIAGSDQPGPQVCLHNNEWWKVAMNGKDVAPNGETLIDRPTVDNPKGEGDPDAVTCRTPIIVSRKTDWVKRYSPEICNTNRFWADVIKNHQMVDVNGKVVSWRQNYGGPVPGFNFESSGYDSGRWQSGMPIGGGTGGGTSSVPTKGVN